MNTKIFKVDPKNVEKQINDIKNAAELLSMGELVVFPTETVTALAVMQEIPMRQKRSMPPRADLRTIL